MLDSLSIFVESILLQIYTFYTIFESFCKFLFPPEPKSLAAEIILVTGSGRGIGEQICLQLVNSGARKIICWDINKKLNDLTVEKLKELGANAYGYTVDVSDQEKVIETCTQVKKEVGNPTIIFNNAGITNVQPMVETSYERIDQLFKINIFSQFWILKEFLPSMINTGHGHIIATSSGSALMAIKNLVPYGATKHAIVGLMEGLREEIRLHPLKPDIKFTTIFPFFVDTPINEGATPNTRFPSLIPIWGPKPIAEQIVDGIRRNKEYIYTPKFLGLMSFAAKFLPNKAISASAEFFQCTLEPENKSY